MRFFNHPNEHTYCGWWWQIAASCLLVSTMLACSYAPYTQRRQILLTEEKEEMAVGEMQYQQLLDQLVINYDPEANRIVRTIGQRLARAAGKTSYLWEFVVIDAPETVNLWVLPGGKVGVCTGIFPLAQDETGLAILIAHAVAHAIARHQGEKNARDVLFELGSMGVTFAPDVLRQTYNLGASIGLLAPFGRVQEEEADYIALLLVAKAGYDPQLTRDVWKRLQQAQSTTERPVELLNTHPPYEARDSNIARWLPEALSLYDARTPVASLPLPALQHLQRPPL